MLVTENPSIELLRAGLEKKGYGFERFEMNHKTFVRFTAPNGRVWLTEGAHIGYPFIGRAITKICDDKQLAYEFCQAAGVIIPATQSVEALPSGRAAATLLSGGTVVVKPHNSSLSNGVTLDVEGEEQLVAAIEKALAFSDIALVQKQVTGEEIRFAVVNGQVKAALLRQKPRLIGDGRSTLDTLLKLENADREALKLPYAVYPQLPGAMIEIAGQHKDTSLKTGEILELNKSTMIKTGASVYNVLSAVDATYIRLVERLINSLGARFVVVDMMLENYKQPLDTTNHAFIEFNAAPVLKLFYSCRDGRHYDIIADLVPMIDEALKGKHE